ncbi:hypothetical protein PUNSTDRAFT_144104, partial [Punctularia strigosozonata HHB-11173 SS5]|uniref:uncharacterized protein n=1 Tax=Punctularia strigosozonata (strain HHB-11173) TaxID=741275 RepID=UPI00044184B1
MADRMLSLNIPTTTLAKLLKAGYESANDLQGATPEGLAKDLRISVEESTHILARANRAREPPASTPASATPGPSIAFSLPLTQSVAELTATANTQGDLKYSTGCPPVDRLLGGGLVRGGVVEVSGPPGSMKEHVSMGAMKGFVERGDGVIIVDTQNMLSPSTVMTSLIDAHIPAESRSLVRYTRMHTLMDLLIFMSNLSTEITEHPEVGLLVLNSLSFPFASPAYTSLPPSSKNSICDRIKQTLSKICATRKLTVLITTQMATKLINADGSAGTFDTGTRAIMFPALNSAYLPSKRTHRIVIVPHSRTEGVLRLLSSPAHSHDRAGAATGSC